MISQYVNVDQMGATTILGGVSSLLMNTISGAEATIAQLQAEANANGGMLDPVQMIGLQIATINLNTALQTTTSIVKNFGDLDKSIAQNIGS